MPRIRQTGYGIGGVAHMLRIHTAGIGLNTHNRRIKPGIFVIVKRPQFFFADNRAAGRYGCNPFPEKLVIVPVTEANRNAFNAVAAQCLKHFLQLTAGCQRYGFFVRNSHHRHRFNRRAVNIEVCPFIVIVLIKTVPFNKVTSVGIRHSVIVCGIAG